MGCWWAESCPGPVTSPSLLHWSLTSLGQATQLHVQFRPRNTSYYYYYHDNFHLLSLTPRQVLSVGLSQVLILRNPGR